MSKVTITEPKEKAQHLSVTFNHGDMEIEMTAIPFNTGRSVQYQLEPDWFSGEDAEQYWDDNWEEIWDTFEKELNK